MPDVYYVNGSFCGADGAKVSVLDRGFLFGDAVYEVLRVENGRIFRSAEHRERMTTNLEAIAIPVPFSGEGFERLCVELVRRNGLKQGTIYLQVTRGAADGRAHLPAAGMTPTVIGLTRAAEMPGWRRYPDGVPVVIAADLRWQRCNIKTTMLLGNTLAKQQARDAGGFEAILVSADGIVTEGASTNVFAVMEGVVTTHPCDNHILPGITRRIVLDLCRANGLAAAEKPFTADALRAADEVFLTGTTADVCPVIRVDGAPVADGRIGLVTRQLMALLSETLRRETA